METQAHFLEQLIRSIAPKAGRSEPDLWFRELRLLDRLDLDSERRKITLHRGFNILWAAPEDPDTEQGLYRDGLAGHASGKTLFCRILRHLLGEDPLGTQSQRDGIASHFLSLWAVASVRVNGKSWIVGRPLATDGEKFAVAAETFEEAIAGSVSPVGGYETFIGEVRSLGKCVEPLFPGHGWRHLLPWLARDQEARFSSLATWREASSQGDNPLTKVVDRHQVMRAVLDLLDKDEPALRLQIDKGQQELEKARFGQMALEAQLEARIGMANEQAKRLLSQRFPEDDDAIEARLRALADVIREGAAKLSDRPIPATVDSAQKRLAEANRKLTLAENKLEAIEEELPRQIERRDRDLTIIRKFKNGDVVDPARADAGFCPRTLQSAIKRGCHQSREPSEESLVAIDDLEAQAKADTIVIEARKEEQRKLNQGMANLREAVRDAERQLGKAQKEADRDLEELTRKASRAEEAAELYASIDQTRARFKSADGEVSKQSEELESKKSSLARLRREMEDRVVELSNIFADVVRAVMGASVEANITITAEGIVPQVTRKSELSGAALDTIKTLAFDLAAVVASIEGKGSHPRFLIHDGPREGDMARVIYERFFLYAAGVEKAFSSPDQASFQYIITTTTPPPKSMREGTRWLLDPVLDSRDKSQRLLKEDF
ncbi:hypothetical protein [Actomonas aquatica]|uniref:Chromosome segregation protein SMC n=1 Tax=Actomonas aquatica TaxID=2866162 RepID=A0ABZ1C8N6_9BACT|nr:hypothetical protein [Opitutus sp. WL0086]WRQ88063.1 hypothetical protein K1X11_001505 [Opitutus sp. WL0086]